MTYEEFINNILETRGRFACGNEYHERHHIVPKCMGGSNDKENLIDLFAREHFEAHRLLALENPENEKLIYAFTCMAFVRKGCQQRYELSSEEYEEAKIYFIKNITGVNNPNYNNHKLSGENHPLYGKHRTAYEKEKMSIAAKNRYKNKYNHPMFGRHHSEESKRKISDSTRGKRCGENNPFYNKTHDVETRRKMSDNHADVTGNKNPSSKIVLQFNQENCLIYIWSYIRLAEESLGINHSLISRCCRNKVKTAGGYQWKYLYDQTRKDGTVIQGAISLGLITEEEALKQLAEQDNLKGEK